LIVAASLGCALAAYLVLGRATGTWPYRFSRVTLSNRRSIVALVALITVYVLVLTSLSIARHEAFHSHAYDLGIFDQVMWNTAHGRLFENTVMLEYARNLLGNHFSPIFLIIAPLYWLWSDVQVLLVLQTVALGLGAVPVFLFTRRQTGSPVTALVMTAAYLLFPALQYVNLFDFHEIALSVPLLGFAVLCLMDGRDRLFLLFLSLALLCREEVAFLAMAFGLYILACQRRVRLGAAVTGLGLVWAAVTIAVLVPCFQGEENYYYVIRYQYLGHSLGEIASTVITRPLYVLNHLLVPSKVDFVLRLLAPVGLIPLAGFEVLALSLPTFAYLLLSDYREQHSIFFQYSAPLIPFIFFATAQGLSRLRSLPSGRSLPWQVALLVYVGVAGILAYQQYGPGPLGGQFHGDRYAQNVHTELGHQVIARIPKNASLSAQADLVPHVSQREEIYTFPNLHGAEYVWLDTTASPWPLDKGQYDRAVAQLRRNGLYELTFEDDGYMLFRRRSEPQIGRVIRQSLGQDIVLFGYDVSTPVAGSVARSFDVYWQAGTDSTVTRARLSTFVAVLDEQGHLLASDEKEPGEGSLRTDKWLPGEIVKVEYQLGVPDVPEGDEYKVQAGVRLLRDAQQESLETALRLGRVSSVELETISARDDDH